MTPSKRYRAIISSSHVDKHGDIMTKEALEQIVNFINSTDKMVRLGVDHRRDFPPRGRIENAELVERDGHFYVEADFVEYEKTGTVEWNGNYVIQYFDDTFQFSEVDQDESIENSISIDPHNFNSFLEAENFSKSLNKYSHFNPKIYFHGRKSEIPDPEIIYKFASAGILYQILKPTVKKLGEKIADTVADKTVEQAKKLSNFVEKSLKELFYRCVPKARPVTIVFDLPGKPHIELIARTRDEKLVLKGLRKKKLDAIREETNSLSRKVNIAKVQFILTDKGSWKFNFLITDTGQTIGTRESIKKREHRLDIMTSKQKKNGR